MQRHSLAGDSIDEQVVVGREGVIGREAEVVDIQVGRDGREGAIGRGEDGVAMRMIFGVGRGGGLGMKEAGYWLWEGRQRRIGRHL